MEDCNAAVAAGVNLMLSAGTTAAICQLQAGFQAPFDIATHAACRPPGSRHSLAAL